MKVTATKDSYTFFPENEGEARVIRTLMYINNWKVEEVDQPVPPSDYIKVGTDTEGNTVEVPVPNLGWCEECKDNPATHAYGTLSVCKRCCDSLNNYFDENYR